MRTNPKHPLVVSALIVGLGFLPAGRAAAQTFTTLYSFTAAPSSPPAVNSDGAWPTSRLLLSGNFLYGTTAYGGRSGFGTAYAVKTDGTGFTNLYSFAYAHTQSSGVYPKSGLVLSSNLLYGTAQTCGSVGYGTVFAVSPSGMGCTNVHEFQGISDGAAPSGPLLLSSNMLYGTAVYGGSAVYGGTVFAMRPDGSGFRVVHNFPTLSSSNVDGSEPQGDLALSASGTTLYGAAMMYGGAGYTSNYTYLPGSGTVFAVNTDGSGFRTLHQFTPWAGGSNSLVFNSDGDEPMGGVVLSASGNTLYGTTQSGGSTGWGEVFAVNTDGSGFTILHPFSSSEGIPAGGLVLSAAGNLLYGTAFCDGVGGTLYALKTDGSGFTILHSFPVITVGAPDNADGTDPNQLMLSGSTLYGTTQAGGSFGSGTIFSLALGLSATVSATPPIVHLGDSIAAVVTALNSAADNITDVQEFGPITVSAGMVSPKGSSGPTMTSSLAPLMTAAFTNLYQATNYGTVTFTGAVTGIGPGGVMTSSPATSPAVSIVPRGDLLLKRASDPVYAGAGVYQKVPIAPQIVTNAVETNEVSTFNVEVVNSDSNSVNFTLMAKADNANWSTHYYLGAQDVTAQIINGMSLPTLAPGANLTFTVNTLSPILSTNGIVLTLGWAGNPALTLDAVQAVSAASPVALTMILHRIRYDGFTQSSLQAGMTDINAPLQPVSDVGILGSQPVITQGVVADEVTPLLIEVQASSSHLAPFPKGRTFSASAAVCGNGALTGPALLRQVYDPTTGAWSTNANFSLSPTHTNAFLLVGPIASDDVHLTGSGLLAAVQITDQTTASQAGWQSFAIRKPPIFLVHGYASPGFWDPAFMQILSSTRPMTTDLDPDNFVVTIRYGQGVVPGYWFNKVLPVYQNTTDSLADCAVNVSNVLAGAKSTILQNWAMTRYDVVAHSQGGVLSRMLSSQNPNGRINAPFRNEDNFFRGRFHRVVTIGSPHNGSRILRFLLALTTAKCESLVTSNHVNLYHANNPLGALVASAAVYAQVAQAKFDPFGDQIKDLNDSSTSGNWYPDPAAQFHLVRAVTDGGKSPVIGDATLAYQVLDLVYPGGGETVIPRGSDGVVDYDSMAANVPEAPLAPNVYDMPPSLAICHAAPLSCFGATVNETASTAIAQHVINALDQNGTEPAANTQFGSFPLPPLLGDGVRQAIDTFACSLFQATELQAIAQDSTDMNERPHPLDGQLKFYYFHINFPGNEPPGGNVTWFAMVYGTNGVTQGGVTCMAGGTNDSQVTVTVDSGLIGDVVLFAFYLNASNQMVQATGQLVTSQGPSGTFPVGIGILPWDPSVPAGSVLPIQLATIYGDGSSSMRYVTEGSLAATSSDPSVISVTDPLNWQLLSPGNAQVVVTWSGFSATNQVNVFLSTSESPQLSIARSGGSLLLGWPLWASDFTLTSNTSLAGPNWQPVKNLPVTNGQQLNLTLPPAGSPSFFRLQR